MYIVCTLYIKQQVHLERHLAKREALATKKQTNSWNKSYKIQANQREFIAASGQRRTSGVPATSDDVTNNLDY